MITKINKAIKKGFGVIEVVLLIAAATIVATLSIITIDQINKEQKAAETVTKYIKEDSDIVLVDNINAKLADNKFDTVHETVTFLREKGFAIENLTLENQNHELVYLKTSNSFGILANKQVVYPRNHTSKQITPAMWRFTKKAPTKLEDDYFSYYLLDECEGEVKCSGGIDVGNNVDISKITYINPSRTDDVVFRTISPTTDINISTKKGNAYHYGKAGIINISESPLECVYEYGTSVFLTITKGKIIVKNGGSIQVGFANTPNVAITSDGGQIFSAYCVSDEEIEATESGYNNFSIKNGGNIYMDFINPYTHTYITKDEVNEIAKERLDLEISKDGFEGVLVTESNGNRGFLSFDSFAKKVNSGSTYKDCVVELTSDLDFSNVNDFAPLMGFEGKFNGRNHIISNLTITKKDMSENYGLFGESGNGIIVENLKLKGINIVTSYMSTNIGGLIGKANGSATISNCEIDSTSYLAGGTVGGFIGLVNQTELNQSVVIENSNIDALIQGNIVGSCIGKSENISYEVYLPTPILRFRNVRFNGTMNANIGGLKLAGGVIGVQSGGNHLTWIYFDDVVITGKINAEEENFGTLIYSFDSFLNIGLAYYESYISEPSKIIGRTTGSTITLCLQNQIFYAGLSDDEVNILPLDYEGQSITLVQDEDGEIIVVEDYEDYLWYRVSNAVFNTQSGLILF